MKCKINIEAKYLTTKLKVDNQVKNSSLKTHKNDFKRKPSCELINLTKTKLKSISKCIFDPIYKIFYEMDKVR